MYSLFQPDYDPVQVTAIRFSRFNKFKPKLPFVMGFSKCNVSPEHNY